MGHSNGNKDVETAIAILFCGILFFIVMSSNNVANLFKIVGISFLFGVVCGFMFYRYIEIDWYKNENTYKIDRMKEEEKKRNDKTHH